MNDFDYYKEQLHDIAEWTKTVAMYSSYHNDFTLWLWGVVNGPERGRWIELVKNHRYKLGTQPDDFILKITAEMGIFLYNVNLGKIPRTFFWITSEIPEKDQKCGRCDGCSEKIGFWLSDTRECDVCGKIEGNKCVNCRDSYRKNIGQCRVCGGGHCNCLHCFCKHVKTVHEGNFTAMDISFL